MKPLILAIPIVLLSYAAAGPLLVSRPVPVAAQDSETAAVQATIDTLKAKDAELSRTLATVVGTLEKIEARRPADPATKTLAELGCKPNDPAFDNAPLIQPVLDAGYNLDVDGLYYTSPLRTPVGMPSADGKTLYGRSCAIAGQGAGYRHGGKGVTGFAAFKPDQACVIECPGEASPGQGMVIRDLYLAGGEKTDGIRVHGARNTSIENCVIRACGGRSILVDPKVGVYALGVRNCSILNCGTGFELRNGTSVCSFAMSSTEIMGGGQGIVLDGWRRGAVFTAVAVEGQSDTKVSVRDSRATFVGCYVEGDSGKVGLLATKAARVNLIDCSVGGHKVSSDSQLNWLGDNMQAGTIGW